MAVPLIPVLAAAATEVGPVLSAIGSALLGGAAVAGVASMSGSTAQTKEDAEAKSRTMSDSTKPCKKCPPENSGRKVRNNHGVNWPAYRYQARVTGFAYDTEGCQWSEEWEWLGIDFDGFRAEECLLQEAKGNYDQFLDGSIPGSDEFFKGFPKMMKTVVRRAAPVKANPPTRLRYYFQGRLTYQKMARLLKKLKIESEYLP
ncbi:restriction endonuclease fold toxin 5 domain-containing protein [Burkholderia contaminans]|uniref:restriction endonuclease fold toxin 5 domain-containing protein n=1 Tax=Burkholderia contaminans TaxID=488447 RepID=UPI001CF48CA1|nr:restriction endonuclease fold toxin 5 domain-containing protein [Burkholderia contaminans]MCA7914348.1 restriction endonuclease fold toxin 5 domain-containing protein [Burkholderia contaminans]UUX41555.1 restriction endonuclease fold toxin 5 domain-containing protein [Burkholderia contaminans]